MLQTGRGDLRSGSLTLCAPGGFQPASSMRMAMPNPIVASKHQLQVHAQTEQHRQRRSLHPVIGSSGGQAQGEQTRSIPAVSAPSCSPRTHSPRCPERDP